MKKIFSNRIVLVLITAVICSSFSVYATIYYEASQINYKGTTLDHAIDDLYSEVNTPAINKVDGTLTSNYLISKQTYANDSVSLNLNKGDYYIFISFTRGYAITASTDSMEGYHDYTFDNNNFTYTNGSCIKQDGKHMYSLSDNATGSRYPMINGRTLVYRCSMNGSSTISYNGKATVDNKAPEILVIYALKI